jgi:predicted HTH domain antitoxin
METVTTRLSEDEVSKLDWLARFQHTNRSQILRKVIDEGLEEELIEQALQLYQRGEISLWKAAELAGKSLSSMMDEAHRRKIPHQYSIDDFLQDIDTLERIG